MVKTNRILTWFFGGPFRRLQNQREGVRTRTLLKLQNVRTRTYVCKRGNKYPSWSDERLVHIRKALGAAAYQLGNTSSRMIIEVKKSWARLVLGWETVQVLPECCS